MSITVYTYNDKVLKNAANDKWLKKAEVAPAGFVMNASNAVVSSSRSTYWEGPNYPDAWQGEGKTIKLTVSQDITTPESSFRLCYNSRTDGAEESLGLTDPISVTNNTLAAGTYTYTGNSLDSYGLSHGYGKYICLSSIYPADVSKITIQILDS